MQRKLICKILPPGDYLTRKSALSLRQPRTITAYGPTALLLSWEQRIDPAISAGVHAYATALNHHPAVLECIPAYASLLVRYAAPRITAATLKEFIYDLRPPDYSPEERCVHELPVRYDGPDLKSSAQQLSLSPAALIELHCGPDYQVYQLGFRPGFAFLGDTPAALNIGRRATPRTHVPAGSVGLAGRQTGVYPADSPGGWQLIGRCPVPLLRSGTDPVRLRAGDLVRFLAVGSEEFIHLQNNPPPWPER